MTSSQVDLLRDLSFRRLFASTATSALGTQVAILAIPLVALLTLKASPFEVGVLTAMSSVALLLVGLPAGAWVDRMRSRNVIIASELMRGVVLLTIPVAWWAGVLTIPQLYATTFLVGVCNAFGQVASQTYLPHLVGRANLVEGNAKLGGIQQVSRLGGPAVAGQAVALLTAPVSLLVTSILLFISSVFVFGITKREDKPTRKPGSNLRREIGEGIRFVFRNRLMRAMAAGISWSNLCGLAYSSMTMVFMADTLQLKPGVIGAMLSISGIGGLLGAFATRPLVARLGQGPTMWITMLLSLPFLLVLPMIGPDWRVWLAAAAYAVSMFGMVVVNVIFSSATQAITPDPMLGRMNATLRFLNWSTMPIGAVLGGLVGTWLGPRITLVIAAAAMCLGFLPIFLSPLRTMRRILDESADASDLDAPRIAVV